MKKKWMAIISIAAIAVMVFGILSSGAWFTDTKTSQTNTFTAGKLTLDGPGIQNFTVGNISDMVPGEKTADAVIMITNSGTTDLAWFGNWEFSGADNKLYEALYVDFAKMEFLSPGGANWQPDEGACPTGTPGSTSAGPDTFILNGKGNGCWAGGINDSMLANSANHFGVISLRAFDNNVSMAPGFSYEHMGALKPGYSYKLTIRFGFAEGAGNEYQGNVASPLNVKFSVNATQLTTGALSALPGPTDLVWLNKQIAKQTMP